jgi:hypothetical protein
MRRCIALIFVTVATAADDPVLLASRRAGWIEVFSPDTLATVARIPAPAMTESVASDASGQHLFIASPRPAGAGCCALYALDPLSARLSFLVEPAQSATITGSRLFTQRGNVGIEVFDPRSLQRQPAIRASGVYRMRPSPDGRLLFGIAHFPRPSLELFDAARGVLLASHPLPEGATFASAWLGQQFFLLIVRSGKATLQPVSSADGQPGAPVRLSAFSDCRDATYDAIAAGGQLAIYAVFGGKSDGACAGGYVLADPSSGAVMERFDSDISFRQVLASGDGRYLYGLDTGSPAWREVRIVKLETATGNIAAERRLDPDVWYLTEGRMPGQ